MPISLSFMDMLRLAAVFTPAGMDSLKQVVDGAKDRGRDGVRAAVYQAYPWAEEVLTVALDRDPEGAYQYVLECGQQVAGPVGVATVKQYRAEIYQVHGWLQGELDKPRPEITGVGGRG